jgi:hypothetical protein
VTPYAPQTIAGFRGRRDFAPEAELERLVSIGEAECRKGTTGRGDLDCCSMDIRFEQV